MKKKFIVPVALALLIIILMGVPSFRGNTQKNNYNKKDGDSTKSNALKINRIKGDITIKAESLENALKELELANKSLQNINLDKINAEVEKAMQEIDVDSMQELINKSLAKVDMNIVKESLALAMKEIEKIDIEELKLKLSSEELAKMKKEIEGAKINVNEQMEKAKLELKEHMEKEKVIIKEQIEKAREEIRSSKLNAGEQMENAKIEMAKAKVQIAKMKEGLLELEKDGLIKKDEKINIKFTSEGFFINDVKQSNKVEEKYRKYFDGAEMGD